MPLSWNEIKSRALAFSKRWADAANEDSEAKPFLIDFFEIFGLTDKRIATFEHAVKKHGGKQGFVDLFWPGILLVEMKSRGRNLDRAYNQAMDYYDPLAMPPDLLKAHQRLDAAVDAAYGFKGGNDAARVAFLFERYRQLTSLLPAVSGGKAGKTRQQGRNE